MAQLANGRLSTIFYDCGLATANMMMFTSHVRQKNIVGGSSHLAKNGGKSLSLSV